MNINNLKNTAIEIYDDIMNTIATGGNLKTALEKYFTGFHRYVRLGMLGR